MVKRIFETKSHNAWNRKQSSPRFLAFKTPLDERYDDQVPVESRFSPSMLFQAMKAYKVQLGLCL